MDDARNEPGTQHGEGLASLGLLAGPPQPPLVPAIHGPGGAQAIPAPTLQRGVLGYGDDAAVDRRDRD